MNFSLKLRPLPVLCLLVLSGCGGTEAGKDGAAETMQQDGAPEAIEVGFIEVMPVEVNPNGKLPGRVVAYEVAEIRPQVSGIIQSRLFEEGGYVEEGQRLYQIDPARYEAELERAKAGLKDAEAQLENASLIEKRFNQLVDGNAVTQQQYDDALSRLNQAKAAVDLAQAEVRLAEIDLDYTEVQSPISGFISPSSVTRGALVTALQEPVLATVRQLDPIYVDLFQPAAETRQMREMLLSSGKDEKHKGVAEVTLFLDDTDEAYPHAGCLDATELAVNPRTGAIRLRAQFINPNQALLPGMFVRATVQDIHRRREIVVPQKAVNLEPDGSKSIWTIADNDTANKRKIRTGATVKNHWIILDGLDSGDRVVVEGTLNLREGVPLLPEKMEGYVGVGRISKPTPHHSDRSLTAAANEELEARSADPGKETGDAGDTKEGSGAG